MGPGEVSPSVRKKLDALAPRPIDPVWIWKLYRSPSPPTAADAAAIVAEANRRERIAAGEKKA
jgi:hypothetical protein